MSASLNTAVNESGEWPRDLAAFCRGMAEYYERELSAIEPREAHRVGLFRNYFHHLLMWRARENRFINYFALPPVHAFQSMHGSDSCWHCDLDYAVHP